MTQTPDIKTLRKMAGVAGRRGRPAKDEAANLVAAVRKSAETDEQRVVRISERFTVMYRLAKTSITGDTRGLVVSGAPGVGKSHTIKHLLYQAKDRGAINYIAISGTITPVNLYKVLYKFRNANDVILLDDCDTVYENEDSMNLLKAALDSSDSRHLYWLSDSNSLAKEGIENSFEYRGSIIFITNRDLQTAAMFDKGVMSVHYKALMDRAVYLDLQLHTPEDIIAWVSHMVMKNHILVQRGLSEADEKMVVEWVQRNYTQIPSLSLRLMNKLAGFVKNFPKDWENMARITAFRVDPLRLTAQPAVVEDSKTDDEKK